MQKIGLPNIPHRSLEDLVRFSTAQFGARIAWHKIWRALQIDAILMPVAPHTAVPKDTWRVINYTGLFNFLDYPACTIPVGYVNEQDVPDGEAKYGAMDAAVYGLCKLSSIRISYHVFTNDIQTPGRSSTRMSPYVFSWLVRPRTTKNLPMLLCRLIQF